MLKDDEKRRNLSYRTKGHIEVKMHMRRGELFVAIP
jgi:hypothetical protein